MTETTLNQEVQVLYDRFHDNYDESLVSFRHEAYLTAQEQSAGEPKCLQHAKGFSKFLSEKPVTVRIYDLLAGHVQHVNTSASIPLQWPKEFYLGKRIRALNDIPREVSCYKEMAGNLSQEDEKTLDWFINGAAAGLIKRWPNGHVIPGFELVIKQGYGNLEQSILNGYNKSEGERKNYFEAMLIANRAAQNYIGRYEEAALNALRQAETGEQKKSLKRIADACSRIKTKAPSNFFEAVQAVFILHEMLVYENHSGSMSLGRIDQILNPFYEEDKAAGNICFQEAEILIQALWLKLASVVLSYQNVTIGGADAKGNSAVNDITLLCMRASRKLKQDQPLLSLRYTENMGDECWKEAIELVLQGGGFPAFFNDAAIIPAKKTMGVVEGDVWNYGIVGCVEPSIGGKEYSNTEELRINWVKILELMLNNGVCTMTGIDIGLASPKRLNEIKDFESFYNWYKDELTHVINKCINAGNMLDTGYPVCFPSPFMSSTFKGCIEKGEDVSAKGPEYCFSTANSCGMANTIDSLLAIKEIVFDKKMVSLNDYAKALRFDFEGNDALRSYAINRCPKYGNDIPEVDKYFKEIVDLFCSAIRANKNRRGGSWQAGLYTVMDHSSMGMKTGATPDGRKKGVSLANAIASVQGMDTHGPTAAIQSALCFDHKQAANGLVLDIKFSSTFFEKENHKKILRPLIEGYFKNGGMEIQFNIISRETLLEAQREPQKHKNLLVRVSGFSAYFADLDENLQNEIIARTEHSEY